MPSAHDFHNSDVWGKKSNSLFFDIDFFKNVK